MLFDLLDQAISESYAQRKAVTLTHRIGRFPTRLTSKFWNKIGHFPNLYICVRSNLGV